MKRPPKAPAPDPAAARRKMIVDHENAWRQGQDASRTVKRGGWETPELARAKAREHLTEPLHSLALEALYHSGNDEALARVEARITAVVPILKRIDRLCKELLRETYVDPVPLEGLPDAAFWRLVTDLCRSSHAANEALPRQPLPRRKEARRPAERSAFLAEFLRRAGHRADGPKIASGLAYFAIEVGMDEAPMPRETLSGDGLSLSASDAFRRDNVKTWQKLLRTFSKRGERAPRKR